MRAARLFLSLSLALLAALVPGRASGQGPSIGIFRWQLLPYCDVLAMDVAPVLPDFSVLRLTGTHDRCGVPGFLAIEGTATAQPNGTYEIRLTHASSQGWAEPDLVAVVSPATASGTWGWDGEFGNFVLMAAGQPASGGNRLRPRGNTAFGNGALSVRPTQSRLNSAFGWHSLPVLQSVGGGAQVGNTANTAVGAEAGVALANGANNVLLGAGAGRFLTTGSDNIYVGFVGSGSVPALATESATVRLGDAQTRAFVAGVSGITTGLNDAVPVVIDSQGQLGTVVSTARAKDHIEDLGRRADLVQRLRPVSFSYTRPFADGSRPTQYGLIAEEVAAVAPELVAFDRNGQPATVKYHVLPSLLVAEVQRLERERARLAADLEALRAQVAALAAARPR